MLFGRVVLPRRILLTGPALALMLSISAPAVAQGTSTSAKDKQPAKVEVFAGYAFYHPGGSVATGVDPNNPGGFLVTKLKDSTAGFNVATTYFLNRYAGLTIDTGYHDSENAKYSSVMGGLTFRYPNESRLTPFAHALVGLHRLDFGGSTGSGIGAIGGGGVDVDLVKAVNWRLFQLDYEYARHSNSFGLPRADLNGVRLATGLVFTFGGGPPSAPAAARCTAQPTEVLAGEPVKVTAAATNFNPKKKLTYNWASTGGKAEGAAETASVDTSGLAPGSYNVTAHVSDGKKTADCTASFSVRSPRGPTISCTANPTTVQTGQSSTIDCTGSSPENRPLTYTHQPSAGSISGEGNRVTLNTTGASVGPITTTSTVTDDRNLSASTTTTVTVEAPPPPPPPKPEASKLNEIAFKRNSPRVDNTAKAILDDVALRLQREPDAKAVVVGHSDPKERGGKKLAAQRAQNTKTYLTKEKGIDPSRIEVRSGTGGGMKAEIYLVPAGASFTQEGTEVVSETPAAPARARRPARKKKQ